MKNCKELEHLRKYLNRFSPGEEKPKKKGKILRFNKKKTSTKE